MVMIKNYATALCATVCIGALATPSYAQSQVQNFNIEPSSLKAALDQYAHQSGAQIVYRADQVKSVRSPGARGSFTPQTALNKLLVGTGFVAKADSSGAIAIVRAPKVVKAAYTSPTAKAAASAPANEPDNVGPESGAVQQDIVVTGSRIQDARFVSPTPIIAVDEERLNVRPQVAESLREMPVLRNSSGPQTHFGNIRSIGHAQMNLRNLGPQRTLVLLNGQRFVTSLDSGAPDVALFPSSMIDRVDIVTGGASSAYGSDAVAGVVNFVVDTDFTGLKGGISAGISSRGDNKNYAGNLAFGSAWGAEDRGHFLISYEGLHRDGMRALDRAWARRGVGIVNYPDQTPALVLRENVRRSDVSEFGVIASGPLKGTSFTADGRQRPFIYGTDVTDTNMIGGEGPYTPIGNLSNGIPVDSHVGYARLSYDVAPEWTVALDGNFGQVTVTPNGGINYLIGGRAPQIGLDNAFLDPTLRQRMIDEGIDSFQVNKQYDFGDIQYFVRTVLKRGVLSLAGKVGPFKADAYLTYGENKTHNELRNMLNTVHLNRAVDAVYDPASDRIVCRSSLTDPTNGCVPYNIMARAGSNDPAALDYIKGDLKFDQITTQLAGGLSFNGTVAELPAGPLAVAFGGEFRRETYKMIGDELSQRVNPYTGALGWWRAGSAPNVSGSNSSKGVFAEVGLPVFIDQPFAKSLDLNLAMRLTDYRFSGSVVTWKLGGNWEPIDGIRLRMTRSRDIREPTLGQLYVAGGGNAYAVIDRVKGETTATSGVQRFTSGNLDLKPEVANTLTYGVVFTPDFLPGFALAIDRYDININNAISSLEPQVAMDECANGVIVACAGFQRDGAGNLTAIYDTFYNLAVRRVSGIDFDARYNFNVGSLPGRFTLEALATYQDKDIRALVGAVPINRAGETGIYPYPGEYQLKWRGSASFGYSTENWSAALIGRYSGSGVRNVLWKSGVDIDKNEVPAAAYLDFRFQHNVKFGDVGGEVYFIANNILDKQPPLVGNDAADTVGFGTNSEYDMIGATFRVGFQFKY